MSTYTRPSKTVSGNGGTAMVAGKTLPAAELNAEFDNLTNAINSLNEDNIDAGAQIPNSVLVDIDCAKVVDHADDEATYNTRTTPGDTGTPSLPTDLEEELERIRYRIDALKGYRSSVTYTTDGDANATASWYEPLIRGRNLLANAGFEGPLADTDSAPNGWTEVGTITGAAIESAAYAAAGADKRSFKFDTSSTGEGVSQTVTGLKASTKYLFGVLYEVTTGSIVVSTQGGLAASNNYQDPSITDTGTGLEIIQCIVQTDSSGTDLVFGITSGTATSDINLVEAWVYELGDDIPSSQYSIPTQTALHDTTEATFPATFTGSTFNWETVGELSLSQYIPGPGYRLIFDAQVSWTSLNSLGENTIQHGIQALLDSGSGAAVVDGPYITSTGSGSTSVNNLTWGQVSRVQYVVDNPTPGATYAFTVQVGAYNNGTNSQRMTLNPLVGSEQSTSRSWLRVERM